MNENFERTIKAFAEGGVIMVHDEHREEEADLFCLAESITAEKVNFMLQQKGFLCAAIDNSRFDELRIPLMIKSNNSQFGTNFGVLVDGIGVLHRQSTGVSAADRAETLRDLAKPNPDTTELVMPGHVATLQAQSPSNRFGHTEASVELARAVGKTPVVAICEVLDEKGASAKVDYQMKLAEKEKIPRIEMTEIRTYLEELGVAVAACESEKS